MVEQQFSGYFGPVIRIFGSKSDRKRQKDADRVYDGPSYKNAEELWNSIKNTEEFLNINKQGVLKNLLVRKVCMKN